ncbi:MAG: hypothetical protein ACLFVJ_01670 [Persicimonas sp.]
MNMITKTTALGALSLMLVGLGACVDQEPSMSLKGSVAFEGEVEEAEEEGADPVVRCEAELDPGASDLFFSRAVINIDHLRNEGQVGPPTGGSGHPWFEFYAEIVNLLEESTQVGAGGGSEGNFQGLSNDQNYIMLTGATVRFPSELNQFNGAEFAEALEKKELFSMLLESNGGATIVSFPIIGPREIGALEAFHDAATEAEFGSPDPEAVVPLVAEITIEGETFSGKEVESNKFQFPIDVCQSCEFRTTPTCSIPQE